MTRDAVREQIRAVVSGDVRAVASLATLAHESLVATGFEAGELVVTRDAVRRTLIDRQSELVNNSDLNRWAWFVSRGYISATGSEPVKPLPIDYEPDFEETIARVIGRLTELGDLVDGVIEPGEIAQLMRDLHVS